MRNFLESPALSIRPFQVIQREVMYSLMFLEKMKSRRELFKNCGIHGKNVKFSIHIISEHL